MFAAKMKEKIQILKGGNMKKLFGVLIAVAMLFGIVTEARADDNDGFTITVTIAYTLTIQCKDIGDVGAYGTWALSSKATSTATTMTSAQGVLIKNTSDVKIDLKATAAASSAWTADTSIGANKYKLQLKGFSAASAPGDLSSATPIVTDTQFETNSSNGIPVATNWYVYSMFTTPSSSSSGQQQSISVTITATVH